MCSLLCSIDAASCKSLVYLSFGSRSPSSESASPPGSSTIGTSGGWGSSTEGPFPRAASTAGSPREYGASNWMISEKLERDHRLCRPQTIFLNLLQAELRPHLIQRKAAGLGATQTVCLFQQSVPMISPKDRTA